MRSFFDFFRSHQSGASEETTSSQTPANKNVVDVTSLVEENRTLRRALKVSKDKLIGARRIIGVLRCELSEASEREKRLTATIIQLRGDPEIVN